MSGRMLEIRYLVLELYDVWIEKDMSTKMVWVTHLVVCKV